MYSDSEVMKLVNAQSKADRNEAENPVPKNPMNLIPLLCSKETSKLVNAQSSKQIVEEAPKKLSEQKTYSFPEVFALQNGCYDPRNFGKVSNFKKKTKLAEKDYDLEEEYSLEESA